MAEITTEEIRGFLGKIQGQLVTLRDIRTEFNILPGTKSFDAVRNIMFQLAEQRVVKANSRGAYKVITQIKPVSVFGIEREDRPPFNLRFPYDFERGVGIDEIMDGIVIREHDCITIGGKKNQGKTALSLGFCGENIDHNPVLMGNEYTQQVGDTNDYEPQQRFVNRLKNMDWVNWVDKNGRDKFCLLPVRADYAEHIVKDKINIIDWVNIDADRLYDISKVMDDIKTGLGRGIAIVALQKGDSERPRGGQFAQDFTDCEFLLDNLGELETLLRVGYVKESTKRIMGRTFAFEIANGVKILNFREVKKCPKCYGKKWRKQGNTSVPCDECSRTGYIDK